MRLAQTVLDLDRQLTDLDHEVAGIFRTHHDAAIITSLTGIGDVLGAEFLAVVGGSLAGFASADHLAGYAGLAPTPHDSGYRTGNLHRPQRYNRQLQRVFYTSAMISIQHSPASKAYYDGKRAQGKRHTQAVLASPDDASTCSGPCSATTVPTKNNRPNTCSPLDKPD